MLRDQLGVDKKFAALLVYNEADATQHRYLSQSTASANTSQTDDMRRRLENKCTAYMQHDTLIVVSSTRKLGLLKGGGNCCAADSTTKGLDETKPDGNQGENKSPQPKPIDD